MKTRVVTAAVTKREFIYMSQRNCTVDTPQSKVHATYVLRSSRIATISTPLSHIPAPSDDTGQPIRSERVFRLLFPEAGQSARSPYASVLSLYRHRPSKAIYSLESPVRLASDEVPQAARTCDTRAACPMSCPTRTCGNIASGQEGRDGGEQRALLRRKPCIRLRLKRFSLSRARCHWTTSVVLPVHSRTDTG